MAGAAIVQMGLHDIGPVAGMMAVGAGLAVRLAEVGCRIDIDRVVDGAAGNAMVVTREVGAVAIHTLS